MKDSERKWHMGRKVTPMTRWAAAGAAAMGVASAEDAQASEIIPQAGAGVFWTIGGPGWGFEVYGNAYIEDMWLADIPNFVGATVRQNGPLLVAFNIPLEILNSRFILLAARSPSTTPFETLFPKARVCVWYK